MSASEIYSTLPSGSHWLGFDNICARNVIMDTSFVFSKDKKSIHQAEYLSSDWNRIDQRRDKVTLADNISIPKFASSLISRVMIKLPLETYKLYQGRLRALGVSSRENPHYVKWVRYFLDFEEKYGAQLPDGAMVDAFIEKLARKGQSPGLCDQARQAVDIYLEISQPRQVKQARQSAVGVESGAEPLVEGAMAGSPPPEKRAAGGGHAGKRAGALAVRAVLAVGLNWRRRWRAKSRGAIIPRRL
jgi:hypothetical protein